MVLEDLLAFAHDVVSRMPARGHALFVGAADDAFVCAFAAALERQGNARTYAISEPEAALKALAQPPRWPLAAAVLAAPVTPAQARLLMRQLEAHLDVDGGLLCRCDSAIIALDAQPQGQPDGRNRWWAPVVMHDAEDHSALAFQCVGVLDFPGVMPSGFSSSPCGRFALDDPALVEQLRSLIAERRIECIVETGIFLGQSTVGFAQLASRVYGIDADPGCLAKAAARLAEAGIDNAVLLRGNSPAVLADLVELIPCERTLFFLDAHWGPYWPLRDEIAVIPRGKGIIVVHDAQVPGRPDLGFDAYAGQPLNESYLHDALLAWSGGEPRLRVDYNFGSSGDNRGVLIASAAPRAEGP